MEGIVLKSTPYQETGRVISLFTRNYGRLSVIIPRISKKTTSLHSILSPLSLSFFHLIKGRTDLHKLQEASLINPFLPIRTDFDRLKSAGQILQILQTTQAPDKPAPALFNLTAIYLTRLQTSPNPSALSLSFQTKLLRHDGLFPSKKEESPIPLTDDEWATLFSLCLLRTFPDIESLTVKASDFEKITALLHCHT